MEPHEKLTKLIHDLAEQVDPTSSSDDGIDAMARLLRTFVPDPDQRRAITKLVDGLVYRILLEGAATALAQEPHEDAATRYFREHTAVSESSKIERLRSAVERVEESRQRPRPNTKLGKKVRKKWKGQACYLCGELLEDGDSRVDHRFPRSAGGANGNANKNLAVAHAECDSHKWDMAFPGDAPLLRMVFNNPPMGLKARCEVSSEASDEKRRDLERASAFRIAVVMQHEFQAIGHDGDLSPIHDGGEIQLMKIYNDQPWWFANSKVVRATEEDYAR